jgi:hypothetical protein
MQIMAPSYGPSIHPTSSITYQLVIVANGIVFELLVLEATSREILRQ